MHFLDLAAERFSVLQFDPRPIEQEKLTDILRAGQLAPTACNNQPQRILVLTGAARIAQLQEVTHCKLPFAAALLVCYDKTECWVRPCDGKPSGDIDASIVTTHMMMEATELGLGSIWVMSWNPDEMRDAFAIPARFEPVSLLILGYRASNAKPRPGHLSRKALQQTVFWDSYSE